MKLPSPSFLSFSILILFSIINCPPISAENPKFTTCSKTIQCGTIPNITYPFYDGQARPEYCGHPGLKLNCNDNSPQITISNHDYNLLGINKPANTITISMTNLNLTNACPNSLTNSTFDFSTFNFSSADQNLTFLYDCSLSLTNLIFQTECDVLGSGSAGYYLTQSTLEANNGLDLMKSCKSVWIPILRSEAELINKSPTLVALVRAFKAGFELGLIADSTGSCSSCVGSGGACGSDSGRFVCYCADGDFDSECGVDPVKDKGHKKRAIIIGISIGVVVLIALFGCYSVFTRSKIPPYILQKHKPIYKDVEDSLKNYASLVPKRYSYTYIEKITKSFKEKLGEGGYGSVFMGSLQDGCNVAVKVSKRSKGDGQDFVNEVMSISRTSHVNVVPLLGFCFEGHKRALIYEFMPNGSLEKFIRGRELDQNNQHLSTLKLFEISLGVARGLEYLHRGCNTRMVHFDIKPHNILLDAEFTPKISDFGLAKSLKQNESIISMSGARGTAGYIAPEIVFRSFGGVSYKANVYSFGMMVLEMVGCRKRVNGHNVEDSSENYFPQWIYKQLEQGTNTNTLDFEMSLNEEKEVERKMILVGLGCIQTNPSSRPTMSRVVEMLEGKVDLLEVPPMPTLASPPREHQHATNDDSINAFSSSVYART